MSQESNKEPAFMLEVGCVIDAAVYIEKETGENGRKQACPDFSPISFSACFARARSCASQTAALVRSAFGCAVFSAEKTSGIALRRGNRRRAPQGAPPARFAAAKRRSPAGASSQQSRQADGAAIASAKRIEKEPEADGQVYLHTRIQTLFR